MKNNHDDEMLQVAIADGKAIIMLSLINRADLFNEIVRGVSKNVNLELISEEKTLSIEVDGRKFIYKGSMKEYKEVGGEATFVMLDTQRFSLNFGDYKYGGYFPVGTRRKIKKEVKEVVFDLFNTITVGKLPTHLGMSRFTVNGITNIIV